jgi:hypothetical protein
MEVSGASDLGSIPNETTTTYLSNCLCGGCFFVEPIYTYFFPDKMGHSATFQPKYPLRSAATIRPFWPKCHQDFLILERAANRRNKKFKQVR